VLIHRAKRGRNQLGRHGHAQVASILYSQGIVAKRNGKKVGLADPSRLVPWDEQAEKSIRVVIETPKGSRNKYAFDQNERVFQLKTVLPAGMTFPYDFGFIPSTTAEDGDPVDVLVLMDEPAFPGCVLTCRAIGIIEGEQRNGKGKERNDRVVAVEQGNHSCAAIKDIDDLGKPFVRELEEFFINYHDLTGKKYRVIDVRGSTHALRRIQDGIKAAVVDRNRR